MQLGSNLVFPLRKISFHVVTCCQVTNTYRKYTNFWNAQMHSAHRESQRRNHFYFHFHLLIKRHMQMHAQLGQRDSVVYTLHAVRMTETKKKYSKLNCTRWKIDKQPNERIKSNEKIVRAALLRTPHSTWYDRLWKSLSSSARHLYTRARRTQMLNSLFVQFVCCYYMCSLRDALPSFDQRFYSQSRKSIQRLSVYCAVLSKVEKKKNIENIHFKSFSVLHFASILVQWRLHSEWEYECAWDEPSSAPIQIQYLVEWKWNSQMQWMANEWHKKTAMEQTKREGNDEKLIYAKSRVGTLLSRASSPECSSGKAGENLLMIC